MTQEQHNKKKCTWTELTDYMKSGLFEQDHNTVLPKPLPREEALKILEQMEKEATERRAKRIE